jgi:hypothetical protein
MSCTFVILNSCSARTRPDKQCAIKLDRIQSTTEFEGADAAQALAEKLQSLYWHTVPGARNTCRVIALLCVALLTPSPRSTL